MLKERSKVEQRYDAVVAVIRDGMAVTEVAAKFGVHRDTVYVWLARYEAGGLDGLAERSHRPHRSPLQMAPATEARVLEFLSGRIFDDLATAQAELDTWVGTYNTDRPHQSLGMATPAERFGDRPDATTGPALDVRALAQDRSGDDWISRTVSVNGTISVSNQVFSVGKHRGGRLVDVRVRDQLLEVWDGMELVKSTLRTSKGVVRKKKAEYHHWH